MQRTIFEDNTFTSSSCMRYCGRHGYARSCLGWPRLSVWAREAVSIANFIFEIRNSSRMHRKLDTISDGSGDDRTTYLQILTRLLPMGGICIGQPEQITAGTVARSWSAIVRRGFKSAFELVSRFLARRHFKSVERPRKYLFKYIFLANRKIITRLRGLNDISLLLTGRLNLRPLRRREAVWGLGDSSYTVK